MYTYIRQSPIAHDCSGYVENLFNMREGKRKHSHTIKDSDSIGAFSQLLPVTEKYLYHFVRTSMGRHQLTSSTMGFRWPYSTWHKNKSGELLAAIWISIYHITI
jgi:hypothetical protein